VIKIKIIFILILFRSVLFSQERTLERNLIIVKNQYTVSYNEEYEQPNWVVYRINKKDANKSKVSRKGLNFHKEKGIRTSDNLDYSHNVWDKGHFAPAADFTNSIEDLKETFSYLNCSLQHEKLNRGAWKNLESKVRIWADSVGYVTVIDESYFGKNHIKLETGAHIPSIFYKHVIFPNNSSKCYRFYNTSTESWENKIIKCSKGHYKIIDMLKKY